MQPALMKNMFLLSVIVLCLNGCGTIINGTSQRVKIVTQPDGAVASLGDQHCTTPCELNISKKSTQLKIEKAGFLPSDVKIDKSMSGWIVMDIITLHGLWIDFLTSGWWNLKDVNTALVMDPVFAKQQELDNKDDLDNALKKDTVSELMAYLEAHPDSKMKPEILKRITDKILLSANNETELKRFLTKFPSGYEVLPADKKLYYCGPEGLRVCDILAMRTAMSDELIVSKIRISSGKYSDFSVDDMKSLKKMGITDPLIQAMLESTAKATALDIEKVKMKELADTLHEIKTSKKELAEAKNSQQKASAAATPSSGGCISLNVALAACGQVPGGYFGKLACESAAKATISCD